jgi:hypothetical protein
LLLGAALQSEPIRLSGRSTSGTAKLRASADAAQAAATSFVSKEEAFAWAKKDNRRLLHVVYRVGDIDRTIKSVPSSSATPARRHCIFLAYSDGAWLMQVLHGMPGHEAAEEA